MILVFVKANIHSSVMKNSVVGYIKLTFAKIIPRIVTRWINDLFRSRKAEKVLIYTVNRPWRRIPEIFQQVYCFHSDITKLTLFLFKLFTKINLHCLIKEFSIYSKPLEERVKELKRYSGELTLHHKTSTLFSFFFFLNLNNASVIFAAGQ